MIPRDLLFGSPACAAVRLSPDGTRLGWLAPHRGVLNIHVAPVDNLAAAAPLTEDDHRGIMHWFWAHDGKHACYLKDSGGDENLHLFAVDLETRTVRDLTDLGPVQAQPIEHNHRHPGQLLVGINDRNPQLHDCYRIDLATGERELVWENPGLIGIEADADLVPRAACRFLPDGGVEIMGLGGDAPRSLVTVGPEDNSLVGPVLVDDDGGLILTDSRGRDSNALVRVDLADGACTELFPAQAADIADTLIDPVDRRVLALAHDGGRRRWTVLADDLPPALVEALTGEAEVAVASRSLDGRRWVLFEERDDGPGRYRLLDVESGTTRDLMVNRPALEAYDLRPMETVTIESRDGLSLPAYLTRPAAPSSSLVLFVHGGPWHRDAWGFNPVHQWLADRGHAVLSVNYRGSTGFGKDFINRANREWAGTMHDDLLDAVDWAVEQGIADRDKVAIMGGSYGGYATLVGLTFTPEVFACGVDIVGPSNLVTLLENFPPYWAPMVPMLTQRVGDPADPADREFLLSRSPLSKVDAITRPLLIGQGANDPRVTQLESDQIVAAMQEKGIPVTYVLYPDEGHGFAHPPNRLSFFAIAEAFLAEHLGGRHQDLVAEDFAGSSCTVPAGREHIPALAALPSGVIGEA